MERSMILAWILVLSSTVVLTCCRSYYSDSVPYVSAPKKVTHLHFFLHDTLTGESPSAVSVASSNITIFPDHAAVHFGSVLATDDPLTVAPEITSEVIGNAQGLTVLASQHELSMVVYLDFGFTRGEFNGSSFSVFSREVQDGDRVCRA
ncbi:hypothetical protein V6N13_069244 [Hibiscus sabdariffa]|uniref:Dirigent protein n=1 Tax=Hibiscus sabdariffa TaxID=183260 RepID=A0ABR2PFR3_9ROSI